MNFFYAIYDTIVQPQSQPALTAIQQNDARPAFAESAEAQLEESYFIEAASISRKLGHAISTVQISREWTRTGASENLYRNKVSGICQAERPVDPHIDFNQIWDIFTYFEQIALSTNARTLAPKFSKFVCDEIRQTGQILSEMCRNAVFPDEPAVFFNHNWPIILLVFDKLSHYHAALKLRNDFPSTQLSLLKRFAHLPPECDTKHLRIDRGLSKTFEAILNSQFLFTAVNIAKPTVLQAWITLVRIQQRSGSCSSWSPFLELMNAELQLDGITFYKEMIRRRSEFHVPFSVADFIFSIDRLRHDKDFSFRKICDLVTQFEFNMIEFAEIYHLRFDEKCTLGQNISGSGERLYFISQLLAPTVQAGREDLFLQYIRSYYRLYHPKGHAALNFFFEDVYLQLMESISQHKQKARDDDANTVDRLCEILDCCFVRVVCEHSKESALMLSRIFDLYKKHLAPSRASKQQATVQISFEGTDFAASGTSFNIFCSTGTGLLLQLMIGCILGSCSTAVERTMSDTSSVLGRILQLQEIKEIVQAVPLRTIVNRIVMLMSKHRSGALQTMFEVVQVISTVWPNHDKDCPANFWSNERPSWQELRTSPLVSLVPPLNELFRQDMRKDLIRLAAMMDTLNMDSLWLHYCLCIAGPLMQQEAMARINVDRFVADFERWAEMIVIPKSEAHPRCLTVLVDTLLGHILAHYDEPREYVNLHNVLSLLKEAETRVETVHRPHFQRFEERFREQIVCWREGRVTATLIRTLLSSKSVCTIGKALKVQEKDNPGDVLHKQLKLLEDAFKSLQQHLPILDWLVSNNVELDQASAQILRGRVEPVLSNVESTPVISIIRLNFEVRSVVEQFQDPKLGKMLLYFCGNRSIIFHGLIKRYRGEYYKSRKDEEPYITIKVARKWLNDCVEIMKKLIDDRLTLSELQVVLELVRNLNVRDEITKICDFFFEEKNVDSSRLVETLQKWLQLLQYWVNAGNITRTMELYDVAESSDLEFEELKRITEQSLAVGDIQLSKDDAKLERLAQLFRGMNHLHLQLFTVLADSENIVAFFKEFNFHSREGRGRFDKLREVITISLRGQDFMYGLFNCVVQAHMYCEPFASKAPLRSVVEAVRAMSFDNPAQLECLRLAHTHIAEVREIFKQVTLSTAENSTALMKTLKESGTAEVRLQQLLSLQSTYQISYSQQHMSVSSPDDCKNFIISRERINEHKRQLTFCLDEDASSELRGFRDQLMLLDDIVEQLFLLERNGHPDYQNTDVRIPLQEGVAALGRRHSLLKRHDQDWADALSSVRRSEPLLTLWSNKEVMFALKFLGDVDGQLMKAYDLISEGDTPFATDELPLKAAAACLASYFQALSNFICSHQNAMGSTLDVLAVQMQPGRMEQVLVDKARRLGGFKRFGQICGDDFRNGLKILVEIVKEVTASFPAAPLLLNKNQFVHSMAEGTAINRVVLKIFNPSNSRDGKLPSAAQILWCGKKTSANEIDLFFQRVSSFCSHVFLIFGINLLPLACRELVLKHQENLNQLSSHGEVHYIYYGAPAVHVHPWIKAYPGLLETSLPSGQEIRSMLAKFQRPTLHCFVGDVGSGKSHKIRKILESRRHECEVLEICISDTLEVKGIILTLLQLIMKEKPALVYLNLSLNSPLNEVDKVLFELLVLGTLRDPDQGILLSLPDSCSSWKIMVECPFGRDLKVDVRQSPGFLLPTVDMLADIEQIMPNDVYDIGIEERFVATYLHAYYTPGQRQDHAHLIDRVSVNERKVAFPESEDAVRTDDDLCRHLIDTAIREFAPNTHARNTKFHMRLYLSYLHRRFKYFKGVFFCYNQDWRLNLGSTMIRQMLQEADNLCCKDLACDSHFPHVYLVFDDSHCAIPMYADERIIGMEQYRDLRKVTIGGIDQLRDTDIASQRSIEAPTRWEKYISWALELGLEQVQECLRRSRFVLEEDSAFKLILFHERRLARLPVILEGETGVGKTFVLEMYCRLLNLKMMTPISKFASLFLQSALTKYHEELKDVVSLSGISRRLANEELSNEELEQHWTDVLTNLSEDSSSEFLLSLKANVCAWLAEFPLLDSEEFRQDFDVIFDSEQSTLFWSRLLRLQTKSVFHRLLVHPGITDRTVESFLKPILSLAKWSSETTFVVFFDEVNTASCLAVFKEVMVDHSFAGMPIPKNVFFAAAINPHTGDTDRERSLSQEGNMDANRPDVNRKVYFVHKLPDVMSDLVWKINAPSHDKLQRFILRKIELHQNASFQGQPLPFNPALRTRFAEMLLAAQIFFTERYGVSAVSNRDIQRTFVAMSFFWNYFNRMASELGGEQRRLRGVIRREAARAPNNTDSLQILERAVRAAIALVYYFRLPEGLDDKAASNTGGRASFETLMDRFLPALEEQGMLGFRNFVHDQLDSFVSPEHFEIPPGIALNQALKENIFAMVACFSTRIPLGLIGAPGSSKTLSFHVIRDNLRGEHSPRDFCRQFNAVDPFFYQCSDFTTSAEVEGILLRALERESQYERLGSRSRCLVFLDEAGLPNERKMELKVLHPYLDEARVAFVAISNVQFDDANRNRMLTVTRSVAMLEDLVVLAKGCLGMHAVQPGDYLDTAVRGLCKGYLKVIGRGTTHFHYRDLIYVCRCLNRRTPQDSPCVFNPIALLRALEENMNGVSEAEFAALVHDFYSAISAETGEDFPVPDATQFRGAIDIVRDALARPNREKERQCAELAPRYKLIIDPSEDASAVRLLFDLGLVPPESATTAGRGTHVFTMSEFGRDSSDVRCAEMVSRIKLCMERGQTVLLVNTAKIHGSLYDLLNLQFRRMTGLEGGEERVYANVAIGAQTYPCPVHPDFMCVVHLSARDLRRTPAPFLSRFEKYVLGAGHFMGLSVRQLRDGERRLVEEVRRRAESFVEHVGRAHFYGYSESTLPSLILARLRTPPPPPIPPLSESNDAAGGDSGSDPAAVVAGPAAPAGLCFADESMFTADCRRDTAGGRVMAAVRSVCAQLLQLVPPEVVVVRLGSLRSAGYYCDSYFERHDHFSLAGFVQRLLDIEGVWKAGGEEGAAWTARGELCRKHVLFARTSGAVLGLAAPTALPSELRRRVVVAARDRDGFEGQDEFERLLQDFADDENLHVLVVVVAARDCSPGHRNLLRQLIDRHEAIANSARSGPGKFYLLLFHFPPQELMGPACHPAVFLRGWEFNFLDPRHRDNPIDVAALARLLPSARTRANAVNDSATVGAVPHGAEPQDGSDELADNGDEEQLDLELLGQELVWDFCVRARVVAATGNLAAEYFSDPFLHDVMPLYDTRARPAARVAALGAALGGLGVLRRLGRAFHVRYGRKYARTLLVKTAEALIAGRDRLHGGFAEAVCARVREEFAAYVGAALQRLCADYTLASLARLIHIGGGAVSHDYAREVLAAVELPTERADAASSGGAGVPTAVPVVRCELPFVPRMPVFAALVRAFEDAREELSDMGGARQGTAPLYPSDVARNRQEMVDGAVGSRDGRAGRLEEAVGAVGYRFARLALIEVPPEDSSVAPGSGRASLGAQMYADFVDDLATRAVWTCLQLRGCAVRTVDGTERAIFADLKAAVLARLVRRAGGSCTNFLALAYEAQGRIALDEPLLRVLCQGMEAATTLGVRLEVPAEDDPEECAATVCKRLADAVVEAVGRLAGCAAGDWGECSARWLRAFECVSQSRGGGLGRACTVALSTLALLLRSSSGSADSAPLRAVCADVHAALQRSDDARRPGLVRAILSAVHAHMDQANTTARSGMGNSECSLCADVLLWNARLRFECAEDVAAQEADVLDALCGPEAAGRPTASRAALALLLRGADTADSRRRFWRCVDNTLLAAGGAPVVGEYVPSAFILDSERQAAPAALTCQLADLVFNLFLHGEEVSAMSVEQLAIQHGRSAPGAPEMHRRIQRAAFEYHLVTALATHFAGMNPAALTEASFAVGGEQQHEGAALAALEARLSTSRNWGGLFCATVARHAGEGHLLALVRAEPFARRAGRWAAELAARETAHVQRVAVVRDAMDRQAAEALYRYRCPHCRAPFVDRVEGCDAMVCGRNYHGPRETLWYGCGQTFYLEQGQPRVLPYVREAVAVPPMPADLTVVDRDLAAQLAVAPTPFPGMDAFQDALRAVRGAEQLESSGGRGEGAGEAAGPGAQDDGAHSGRGGGGAGRGAAGGGRLGLLSALVDRSDHAIPQLQLLPPIAALLAWVRRHAAHRYTREELDGGVTFERLLRDVRAGAGRRAAAAADRLFERAEEAFNTYHRGVGGRINPGACDAAPVHFPQLSRAAPLYQFATLDGDGAPCLLLLVAQKLALAQNEFFRTAQEFLASEGAAVDSALQCMLESCLAKEVSLDEVAETGGACLLAVGMPGELLELIRAHVTDIPPTLAEEVETTALESFNFSQLQRTAALWFVAGRRPVETHSAARPLACRGDGRRRQVSADMVDALHGLVGTDELPAAMRAAVLEAVRDSRGDALQRAVRDFERVAAAAVLDITAPSAEDGSATSARHHRDAMASGAAKANLVTAAAIEEGHRRRRAAEVGDAGLEEYLVAQGMKVGEEASRAVRAPGLRVRHVPALVALLAARIEDLRHLFVHLPPALRHEPPIAAREALAAVLLISGADGDGGRTDSCFGPLAQAQAEVKEALELLADLEDALVQRADEPLRQVVVDYLAGDAAAAPLIARLPACLLCRHTAAVGAELLAHRARLTEVLAESVAAASAAGVWAELPEVEHGAAALDGEGEDDGRDPSRSISPQLEDDVADREDGDREVDQPEAESVVAPAATLPAALTALGLAARRGGDDTWKEIEISMVERIAAAWRGRMARRRIAAVRLQQRVELDNAAAARIAADAVLCIAAAFRNSRARAVVRDARERRRVAAASCLERAWRRCKAQQCVRALAAARATAAAGGDAVLCRLRLGLRGAQRVAMEARATTGTRFRVALLGGAVGAKPAEKAWICAPVRLLEKVRTTWPATAIRGRFQVDLPAAEVEAAAAAGELVLVDAYGAAADVCSGDDGDVQLTREMGLVPTSDLVHVSVSVLLDAETPDAPADCKAPVDSVPNSTSTGSVASAVQLSFWFRRESTLRAVTERCRVALHHTADTPVRVCHCSSAAESLPLDAALTDQAVDAASGMVKLWLDLRDRQEVVVAAQSVGANRREAVIVLPLDASITAMCAAVTTKLDLPDGARHFPPSPSTTLLGEVFSAAARRSHTSTPGNNSRAAQLEEEIILVRGGSLREATVVCRNGADRKLYALCGACPISSVGGLVAVVGGQPPYASKQRTTVLPGLANAVTAQSGMEWHLWPLVQGDTAADVMAWLAVLGAIDPPQGCATAACEGFDLVLPDGVAAGQDTNMTAPGVTRVWLTPSHMLVPLEIRPGNSITGCDSFILRATVGCPCSTLAERAATVCGLAKGRLFCGGLAVPEDWAAADLPGGGGCWSRSSVQLSVEPPGEHASFRLQISFGAVSGPPFPSRFLGFPGEVDVARCGLTPCSALVDSLAAAHGGCALVCTLAVAATDDGDPVEVDLGDDGDITCSSTAGKDCGTTLEELAEEGCGQGSHPTLVVGLRPCACPLTTAIAADGGSASATRAVFVVRQMGAAAICRAALAAHGVPVIPGLDRSAMLWFRAKESSDEEEVDTELTVGDILESLQVELDSGVFVIRYSTNAPSHPKVAVPRSAAEPESASAPYRAVCSTITSGTGSKIASAAVETAAAGLAAEEKKGSQLETAKDAEVVTHVQLARRRGSADYVTVQWKDSEDDSGIGTD